MSEQPRKNSHSSSRLVGKLLLTVVGMFGFGFAMVPLYNVFCEVTGLNGKTGGQAEYVDVAVDSSREVTIQFAASNNAGMAWEFRPNQRQVKVNPGALTEVSFYAHNPTDQTMIAQAVPSVSPFRGADYLHKTECFCFEQQELAAGESVEMPLLFYIDQDLPEDLSKLTLSYTLFDVTANFADSRTLSAK